jgi:hypothetical protein
MKEARREVALWLVFSLPPLLLLPLLELVVLKVLLPRLPSVL